MSASAWLQAAALLPFMAAGALLGFAAGVLAADRSDGERMADAVIDALRSAPLLWVLAPVAAWWIPPREHAWLLAVSAFVSLALHAPGGPRAILLALGVPVCVLASSVVRMALVS